MPATCPPEPISADVGPCLADVGEDGLLARIVPRLAPSPSALVGPGDDTAVVAAPDGRVVATTDVLVEGRDFRRDWSAAGDVGWKAAAQNLADVAAMGAVPTALLVGLVAPQQLPVAWAVGLADGLSAACAGTGAGVVGGDLSSGDAVVVCVTALGDLQGRPAVLRSTARPGDAVAVAGVLGRSAAGLALLEAGRPDADPRLVEAHRRPRPPYDAGPAAARGGATAMLDVSDGLLRDLGRLARASGVAVDLDGAALAERFLARLRPAAATVAADPWQWILGGGEDHALAATFPPSVPLPYGFARVGTVRRADGDERGAVLVDGRAPALSAGAHCRTMRFRSTVELGGRTATGIPVPDDVVAALGAGRRPAVRVTIGGHTYRSSVAARGGRFLVPLSAENRQSTGVAAGDEVDVDLELDTEPREVAVPADLQQALDADPEARRVFEALPYSHRLRWVLSVEDAKTDQTRQRRIAKTVAGLREGRG